MERKVFISILGTGLYTQCRYGSLDATPTRFIQRATIDMLHVKDWSECDAIYILLTAKAREKNWDKSISRRNDMDYNGLEKEIEDLSLPVPVIPIDIPDGKDEKEMWEIFNRLYEVIKPNDNLYIDLTHSFRYIPMLVLVLCNYVKFLKKVKIESISYGNYEARDDRQVAPIVDLLPLSYLQDWTAASAAYLNYGNADDMADMADNFLKPFLKDANTRADAAPIRSFIKALKAIAEERIFCRGNDILEAVQVRNAQKYSSANLDLVIPPLAKLFQYIGSSLDANTTRDESNGFAAAKWCYEHHQYQAAVTILEETIITIICSRHDLDILKIHDRDLVNSVFHDLMYEKMEKKEKDNEDKEKKEKDNEDKEKKEKDNEDKEKKEKIRADRLFKESDDFEKAYNELSEIRNDYNHAGMRDKTKGPNAMKNKIIRLCNVLIDSYHEIEAIDKSE